ncbi:hypothetical protein [Nitrolancea hollandica]|nr:hypothetical protein [Nitrolancea hollandica]
MKPDLNDLLIAAGVLIAAGGFYLLDSVVVVIFAGLVLMAIGIARSR